MKNFASILKLSKKSTPANMGVINPIDESSLQGALDAYKHKLIKPILFGNEQDILNCATKLGRSYKKLALSSAIVNSITLEDTLNNAINYVKNNSINALMKGKIHTDEFMRVIVNKNSGLRTNNHINHLFALEIPKYHKLLFIADAGINILPNIEQKQQIISNCVTFLNKIGIHKPNVALLSATESILPKMPSSFEANEITLSTNFKEQANIFGPLAFDNIISKTAAQIKGISVPMVGEVDLILSPNIETGNALVKALVYLANAKVAGIVLGTKIPIVLTSRADNALARLLSCAMANVAKV